MPNCVEGATYDPWKSLSEVTTYHNYRSAKSSNKICEQTTLLQRRKSATKLKMCQMSQNLFLRCLPHWDAVLLVGDMIVMIMMMIIMMMIMIMMMIVFRCGLTAHSSCITSLAEEHQVCRCVVISSDNNDDDNDDDNDDLKVRGP